MRPVIILLALLTVHLVSAQNAEISENKTDVLPKLELSLEPIGVIFYGPSVRLGAGLTDQLTMFAYARPFGAGLMSVKLKSEPDDNDELTGTHFGLGASYFIKNTGAGLFIGAQAEVGKTEGRWSEDEPWEWYEESTNIGVSLRAGYRVQLNSRLFFDLGLYTGMLNMKNSWDYEDEDYGLSDPEPREHTDTKFLIAPEVAVGLVLR